MILKAQLSLHDGYKGALVYSRNFEVMGGFPASELPRYVFDAVRGAGGKAYFEGKLVELAGENKIEFAQRVEDQEW